MVGTNTRSPLYWFNPESHYVDMIFHVVNRFGESTFIELARLNIKTSGGSASMEHANFDVANQF